MSRSEIFLHSLSSWKDFDNKLKTKEYQWPHDLSNILYLREETEKWNNIPIPLTNTCHLFSKCFRLHGNIIKELIR